MPSLRTVKLMAMSELVSLDTRVLLARLQRLRALHESFEQSDWTEEERIPVMDLIAFKDSMVWGQAIHDVKEVLSKREHVERGGKAARQAAAKSGR